MTPVIITNSSTIDALGYNGGDLFVRFKANGCADIARFMWEEIL